jgi:hypothetical protein
MAELVDALCLEHSFFEVGVQVPFGVVFFDEKN